jgi:hypothetical protein
LRRLKDEGLIRIATRGYQQGLGRPESLVSLREKGAGLLKGNRLIDANVLTDFITADKIRCLEHHLLINEFRVQLMQLNGKALRAIAPNPQIAGPAHPSTPNVPLAAEK